MMALAKLHRYWVGPQPTERLAALRILTGSFALCYLLVRAPHFIGFASLGSQDFAPVGVVRLIDAPLPATAHYLVYAVSVVSGAAFVAGAYYRLSGPLFALCFLWLTSYRSSFGMVFHQDNLPALHLLILAPAAANAVWAVDARRRPAAEPGSQTSGWPVRAMAWVTVLSYVLAGVAKLKNVGWGWGSGELLRSHIAYDALMKIELGATHSPLGAWLVQFGGVFPVLGAMTLLLELGAPLALLGGRTTWVWVIGIWAFHVGVVALMAIGFAYPLSGCAFAPLFAVERLPPLLKRFWPVRRATPKAAGAGG